MRADAFTGHGGSKNCGSNQRAFTRAELLATLAVLFLCAAVLLPTFANTGSRAEQVGCLNNLRRIGIAFQAWGTDHNDHRPWFVPMNEGGTHSHPLRNNVFLHYTPLSNHLAAPILVDPAEANLFKRRADNWGQGAGGIQNPGFQNNAVSYMIGSDTEMDTSVTGLILAADRHVTFGGPSGCPAGGGFQLFGLNVRPTFRGWTNGQHGQAGNLLLTDGRVEFAPQKRLQAVLEISHPPGSWVHLMTPF